MVVCVEKKKKESALVEVHRLNLSEVWLSTCQPEVGVLQVSQPGARARHVLGWRTEAEELLTKTYLCA